MVKHILGREKTTRDVLDELSVPISQKYNSSALAIIIVSQILLQAKFYNDESQFTYKKK